MNNYNKRNICVCSFFCLGIVIAILGINFIENERLCQFIMLAWIIGLLLIVFKPIIQRLYLILSKQSDWSVLDLPLWYENDVEMIKTVLNEKGYQSIEICDYNQITTAWKKKTTYDITYIDLSRITHSASLEVGYWYGVSIFDDKVITA